MSHNFIPTPNIDTHSYHFVYMCPIRADYALCIVDYQGRYYTTPGWTEKGCYECTLNAGCGVTPILHDYAGLHPSTALFEAGREMLESGEHFAMSPYEFRRCPAAGGVCDWLPLGNHDRGLGEGYLDRHRNGVLETNTTTDEQYAQWERDCDFLFGHLGSHALSIRAAKARFKKRSAIKRRRDRKRGYGIGYRDGVLIRIPVEALT